MIDDDADEHERAAAEALARALEGDDAAAPASAPSDALETAALLRAVAPQPELTDAQSRAIYAALGGQIDRHVRPRRARNLVWLGAGALAAAAAVMLYVSAPRDAVRQTAHPPATAFTDLPAPPASLLAAQAGLGARGANARVNEAFEREMRAYRASVLKRIKQGYPALVGMLQPRRDK